MPVARDSHPRPPASTKRLPNLLGNFQPPHGLSRLDVGSKLQELLLPSCVNSLRFQSSWLIGHIPLATPVMTVTGGSLQTCQARLSAILTDDDTTEEYREARGAAARTARRRLGLGGTADRRDLFSFAG